MKTHRLLTALVMSVIVSLAIPQARAQGTIQTYFALGPSSSEVGYLQFLGDMIQGMRVDGSLSPVPFIPSGSSINNASIVSYEGGTGHRIFAGFSAVSPNLFSLDQISRVFGTSYSSSSNMMSGASFGPAVLGIRWGSGGPGVNDTMYASGSANGVLVNRIIVVANAYTLVASNPSDTQRVLDAQVALHGPDVLLSARYGNIPGQYFGEGNIHLCVPEPSTGSLLAIGLIAMLPRRHKSSAT